MMKIVKIFGPRDVGPPIWDILDSHDENSKNIWAKGTWSSIWDFWDSDDENSKDIWAKGTWSSNGGQTGPLCLFTSKRRTGPMVKMMLMMRWIVRMNKMIIIMIP